MLWASPQLPSSLEARTRVRLSTGQCECAFCKGPSAMAWTPPLPVAACGGLGPAWKEGE